MMLRGEQSWTLIEGSLNRSRTENMENTNKKEECKERKERDVKRLM
jgi:hypothetical protein